MHPPHSAKYRATSGTAAQVVAVTLDVLEIEALSLAKLALSALGTVLAFAGVSSNGPASFGMQNFWLVREVSVVYGKLKHLAYRSA
jgi:hypothetical protein